MVDIKGKNIFLTAAFIVVIFSIPLTQTGIELSRGQRPQFMDLFAQAPTRANLKMFEKDLENNCWVAEKLRPWIKYLQFIVLEDCGDKALLGRDGWFFYKPAVQYLIEPWSPDADTGRGSIFSAITSYRDQLAERGIKLMVTIAPNKASVYPEMLTSRAKNTRRPVNPGTLEIIAKLRQEGIEVVDLFELYSRARADLAADDDTRYYLSQDSHWSPQGMALAAKTVAQRLLQLGWTQKGTVEYDLKTVTVKRYGDVLTMMKMPGIQNLFEPQQPNCSQVVNAETGQLYHDDPNSPVLVIGDSFLRIYNRDEPGSAGFIAHLARQLGFGLTSIVNDGGASTLVWQQLNRKPALLTDKKLVIWEFVERDIRFGTEGWQKVPLPVAGGVLPVNK